MQTCALDRFCFSATSPFKKPGRGCLPLETCWLLGNLRGGRAEQSSWPPVHRSGDKAPLSGNLVSRIHSALTLVLQLLQKIKQVNFSLHNSQICFDANGNIYKGYNIIMWNWRGLSWAFDVVGTFTVNPNRLLLNRSKILWHTKDHQVLFCIHVLFIVHWQAHYIPTLLPGYFPITGQMEAVCGEGTGGDLHS